MASRAAGIFLFKMRLLTLHPLLPVCQLFVHGVAIATTTLVLLEVGTKGDAPVAKPSEAFTRAVLYRTVGP